MAVVLITAIKKFQGLAGDVKPTDAPAGSEFYETDTGSTYIFNGSSWVLKG